MRAVRTLPHVIVLISLALVPQTATVAAQSGGTARALVVRAADALGGQARILAIKTLTIEGYGQLAYQNGGGNITSSIDAPQKWIDVNDYARVVDLEHGRSRVRQRQINDFVFAAAAQHEGRRLARRRIDGEVAFNINAAGTATRAPAAAARARRMESLAHPVVFVHMALNPKSTRGQPPHVGRTGAGGCHHSARRRADARGPPVLVASGVGELGWTGHQPRRRHLSGRLHRIRAGERRADADRPQHDDRLPVDRAEQAVCRSTGHRRARSTTCQLRLRCGPRRRRCRRRRPSRRRQSPRASGSCAAPATRCCSSSTIT